MAKITLKLILNEEIRRISVDSAITFSYLQELATQLFRSDEEVLFKYIDDEGDSITISSDEELSEAISKRDSQILRINLNTPKSIRPICTAFHPYPQTQKWRLLHHQAMQLFKGGSKVQLEQAKEILKMQLEISPQHKKKISLYNLACAEALLGNHVSALSYLQDSINAGFIDVVHIENDKDLTSLRELEGFKALLLTLRKSENSCFFMKEERKWNCLQHQILNLFFSGSNKHLSFAKELLFTQLKISRNPEERQISLYNLACVESLFGNLDEALSFLEKSISEGYRNVKHIQDDADLNNLRSLDRFKFLINSLISENTSNLEKKISENDSIVKDTSNSQNFSKENSEPSSEKNFHLPENHFTQSEEVQNGNNLNLEEKYETDSEKQIKENHFEKNFALLDSMGWTDRKRNISALLKAKGDLLLAIELLLGETN